MSWIWIFLLLGLGILIGVAMAHQPATFMEATSAWSGGPRFAVRTEAGIPALEQFREVLPEHLASYRFSYQHEHAFEFEAAQLSNGTYDVLIRAHPDYGMRPAGNSDTHRYDIGTARERICFASGLEPRDLHDACRKAILWADRTSLYIATGKPWE